MAGPWETGELIGMLEEWEDWLSVGEIIFH
jgi:hypothetical protein